MNINLKDLTARMVIMFLVFALALFLPAGTIKWFTGWVFLILFFSFNTAITVWLFKHNPGLLKERMIGFTASQKAWDKVFLKLVMVIFLAWLILMPLDAVRFHWSRMPIWLQAVGVIGLLCSFYIFFLTFRENSYLSPVVRIQEDRGQTVVSTGPYRYVRHPMYSAAMLLFLGTSLLLGSWYGFLLGLVLVGMMAVRAVLEEQTLREGLKGYDAYMAQVKYRLIPHVW